MKQYPLPPALKLSVHSGSDKYSLYDSMSAALERSDAGLHLKTAGTTWLQELAGLAETGSEGCVLVREIYSQALERMDELCAPYACVIDIDRKALPPRREVTQWSSEQWVSALAHNCQNPNFNPHLRQLLHVGYKIAAEMGTLYLDALRRHKNYIGAKVTANLYENHLRPLFVRGSRSAEAGKD